MGVAHDVLKTIFKNAYPDAEDSDIEARVNGLTGGVEDAASKALSFIPGMQSVGVQPGSTDVTKTAQGASDVADEAANSDLGQAVAKGVSAAPISSMVPSPGNPAVGLGEGAVVGATEALLNPEGAGAEKDEGPGPEPEKPVAPPPVPTPPPTAAVPEASKGGQPGTGSAISPGNAPQTQSDFDKQQAFMAQLNQRRKEGIIPLGLAAAGEAIGGAATPFGGKGTENAVATTNALEQQGLTQDQQQFETKLKSDPTSDISKGYRDIVAQIAPELAKDPKFQTMSAQSIGDKLPLIDELMKAKSEEITRQYMIQYQQSIRAQGALGKTQSEFNNDIKNDDQTYQAANKMQDLLNAAKVGAKISPLELSAVQGPIITGVTRANPELLNAFKGPAGATDIMNRFFSTATTGQPSPGDLQQMQQLTDIVKNNALQTIQQKGLKHTSQYQSQGFGTKDKQSDYQSVTGGAYPFPGQQPNAPTAPDATKVISGQTYVSHGGKWYRSVNSPAQVGAARG